MTRCRGVAEGKLNMLRLGRYLASSILGFFALSFGMSVVGLLADGEFTLAVVSAAITVALALGTRKYWRRARGPKATVDNDPSATPYRVIPPAEPVAARRKHWSATVEPAPVPQGSTTLDASEPVPLSRPLVVRRVDDLPEWPEPQQARTTS